MAARSNAKGDRESASAWQALSFALSGLPSSAAVTIDLSRASRSGVVALRTTPFVQFESGPGTAPAMLTALRLQPQRIAFEITDPPLVLTVTLQIACDGPFLFGWLHVPDAVVSTVATSVERLRIVGPGYWAVPVWEPAWPSFEAASVASREVQTLTYQHQVAQMPPDRVPEAEPVKTGKAGTETKP